MVIKKNIIKQRQSAVAVADFWLKKNLWPKRYNGSTLIESLTALAIVTAVMGCAFTVYNQTVSKQNNVMKVRAKFVQTAFEQNMITGKMDEDLSDEFMNVETEELNYKNTNDIKQCVLTIKNKEGKLLLKKNYLKYKPTTGHE